jgi:hypothetical protein
MDFKLGEQKGYSGHRSTLCRALDARDREKVGAVENQFDFGSMR